jgi:hypothetical protein
MLTFFIFLMIEASRHLWNLGQFLSDYAALSRRQASLVERLSSWIDVYIKMLALHSRNYIWVVYLTILLTSYVKFISGYVHIVLKSVLKVVYSWFVDTFFVDVYQVNSLYLNLIPDVDSNLSWLLLKCRLFLYIVRVSYPVAFADKVDGT